MSGKHKIHVPYFEVGASTHSVRQGFQQQILWEGRGDSCTEKRLGLTVALLYLVENKPEEKME